MKAIRKYNNLFFYILYFVWGSFTQIHETVNIKNLNSVAPVINGIALIGLIIFFLINIYIYNFKVYLSTLSFILIIALLGFRAATRQMGITFLVGFILIIASGNINYKNILKVFLLFTGITLFFTVFFNKLGIIPSFLELGTVLRARDSLGFSFYSYSAQLLFYFICAFVVYRGLKITYIELIILEICNYYIYFNTNTRNPYILASVLILFILLTKFFHVYINITKNRFIKFVLSYIFPICAGILWVLCFCIPRNLFYRLDNFLSGRLQLDVDAVNTYGLHLLGRKVIFSTYDNMGKRSIEYNYIDSFYFQSLILYGVIFFVVIIILFTMICKKVVNENNYILAIALFLIAIHAMFDPQLIWAWYNPFCLLLGRLCTFKQPFKMKAVQGLNRKAQI